MLERLVEFGQSDAVGFQVVCPARQHLQRRFMLIARCQCDGDADALAVQAEHPQQRRLAHAADAVDDQHPFGQRRCRQPLLEEFAQVLDVGEIGLEYAAKLVLHRICRSHVFSGEQANGPRFSRRERSGRLRAHVRRSLPS